MHGWLQVKPISNIIQLLEESLGLQKTENFKERYIGIKLGLVEREGDICWL